MKTSACYALFISDYVDNTTSKDYVWNWDEGQGKAAAYAADRGYRMELAQRGTDYMVWWLSNDEKIAAIISVEREYSDE